MIPSLSHYREDRGPFGMRHVVAILLVLFALFATSARADSGADYARQAGAHLVGQLVPPLKLTTIDGQSLDLGALRGRKAIYLKFWATWCVPCREQMPHFEGIQRGAGDDLQVVAVNIGFDDTPAQIVAYRREHGLTMPIVRDDDGHLGELFGLRVTPQHVVIGKDGRIAYVGHLADAALENALATARKATPAPTTATATTATPTITTVLRTGDAVPALQVKTLEGINVPLADPLGKHATVLAFLSPWCERYFARSRPQSSQQCRALREQLVALGRDRSVHWLGIASGLWASEQDLRDYRSEHRIPVPLTLDDTGALFRRFGIRRMPAVIVVDANGRIERQLEPDARGAFDLPSVLAASASMTTETEPLPVESAFALSSRLQPDGTLVLEWKMPPGYYLYRDRFSLKAANAPDAFAPLQWSAGQRHRDAQFGDVTVFFHQAQLRVPVRASTSLPSRLDLNVTYQGCLESSVCYPPTTQRMSFAVPPSLQRDANVSAWQWLLVLAMAFAGGLVLNLMPCVLPVLSLKVLSVLEARDDAIGAKRRALAYTAGVLLSFAVLGAIVLVLRASGGLAGWGVQMQQPWMVATLALVMLAVGLGLSGVVHFGAGLAGVGGRHLSDPGLRGDFLVGVLACVVASPCTAPFMGAALAFALASSHAVVALSIFLALGLGLASPFLLIAFVPATARWLPRPGAWMETLKQLLAFPMYATAVWLLWVLGKQRGVDAMALALLAAIGVTLGLWWFEKHRFAARWQRVVAVLVIGLSLLPVLQLATGSLSESAVTVTHKLPAGAERFTPARLALLRQRGTPVFVDVTADWCLTCKANQVAVLDRSEFRALLAKTGTVYLVADYTRPDPAIAALLKEQGAVGIPLYVSYAADGRSTKLPNVLSLDELARQLGQRG